MTNQYVLGASMQWLYAQFNTIIIHPLINITISLMLGIWYATGTSNLSMICVILTLCALGHWLTNESIQRAILCIALSYTAFGVGIGLATHQRHTHATIAKTLSAGPYQAIARVQDIQTSDKAQYPYTVFLELIKLKESTYGSVWQPNTAVIAAYCHSIPFLETDDVLFLEECTFSNHNPKTGFYDYLVKSGINGTLFCHHLKYTLLQRPSYSFQKTLLKIRSSVFDRVRTKMSEQTAAFYASLFLGNCHTYKTYLKSMKTSFGIWGLSHFLARSGLHLVLFIFLWHILLGYIPLRSRYKHLLMLILNTIYLLLSWSSLSFMRSFAALCFYYSAHLLQQQPSTLHVITLLSCACLLINPMHLFFLDFQLSFGLTFALAWIYQAISWHKLQTNN